jgi:hypothetical protein
MNTIVKLLAGMKIPVKPGQAYQLRLQTLQQYVQSQPGAQQAMERDPQVMAAFEQRFKDLNFQIKQQQNAVIGRGGPEFGPKMLTQ